MRALLLVLLAALATTACGGSKGATTTPTSLVTIPTQRAALIPIPTLRPFPFSTPQPATPRAGVPTGIHSLDGLSPVEFPDDSAVYLSLGDSIQYGCCADPNLSSHPLFAQYLSQQLNRPVVWVSLAGNGTLQDFLHTGAPTQLERAEELLRAWRDEGRDVVLITLSVGGNDLLALRTEHGCGSGSTECQVLFQAMLDTYQQDMLGVYERLNAAKDPNTPVLQNDIYDAMNCGRPGDEISTSSVAVRVFNERVRAATIAGGSFFVDFYEPFRGRACELISGVDPTYAGYDLIYGVHVQAYESLPRQYVDPWRK
jgi:hypothetical protein